MSIHKSLKLGSSIGRARNVYKRHERMEILLKDGRLKDGAPVTGLPKTKVVKIRKGKAKKKAKEEETEAA